MTGDVEMVEVTQEEYQKYLAWKARGASKPQVRRRPESRGPSQAELLAENERGLAFADWRFCLRRPFYPGWRDATYQGVNTLYTTPWLEWTKERKDLAESLQPGQLVWVGVALLERIE